MSSDEIDKSTEQVLEYYKKYSQNRNLPKYFSGTSVSYLPPIDTESTDEQNDKSFEKRPAHSSYQSDVPINIPEIKIVIDEPKDMTEGSPNGSSLESPSAEHKRLEWDNGADIGYNSARNNSELQLRKSSSLPISDNLEEIKPNIIIPSRPTTTITAFTKRGTIDILLYSSSSSSDASKKSLEKIPSSTTTTEDNQKPLSSITSSSNVAVNDNSNSSDTDNTRFEDFRKSINFLKNKFGIPDAQSTPCIVSSGTTETPLTTKVVRQKTGNSSSKSVTSEASKTGMQKGDKSSTASRKDQKKTRQTITPRIVELSITTPINVNCSGLDLALGNNSQTTEQAQIEEFSQHKIESQYDYKNEVVEQQQQDLTSNPNIVSISDDSASSFEYFSVNKDKIQTQKSSVKNSCKESPLATTSKEISLSEYSTDFTTEDIDRLVEELHKLLKTKKISSSTKKKYMKKIFKAFCQFESSSNSTTSSDLFFPKKEKSVSSKVDFKESTPVVASPAASKDVSTKRSRKSSSGSKSITESECQQCIEELESIIKFSPSDSELGKCESTQKLTANNGTSTSKNIYAIASSSGSTQPPTSARLSTFPRTLESESASEDLSKKSNSEIGIIKSIRQDQVVPDDRKISKANCNESGTNFEDGIAMASTSQPLSDSQLSNKSSGDYLLSFAEDERNYPLNWIDCEISRLLKIKSTLDKKNTQPTKKHRHVYKVTEKHDSLERNYVIQTDMVVPEDQNVNNYIINGKEYVVSGSGKPISDEANKADIELNYNEHEINIKIRTICNVCKKLKCVCPSHSKLSSLKTTSNLCLYCKQPVCCCKTMSKSIEDRNVVAAKISPQKSGKSQELCLSCRLVDCVCQKQKDPFEDKDFGSSQIPSTKLVSMVPSRTISSKEASDNSSSHSHTSSDSSNSLKQVFKKCSCTITDSSSSCFFVKKLLDRFQMPQPPSGFYKEAQLSTTGILNSLPKDERSSSKRSSVPKMDKETVTSTEQMEQEINIGLPKISEEFEEQNVAENGTMTYETRPYSGPPKSSSTYRHFGTEAFPNFETAKSKASVVKFHENIQVQPDGKLDKNSNTEPLNTNKAAGDMAQETCSQCRNYRSKSASEKTNVTTPLSGNTSSHSSDSKSSASSRITCYCCKQKAFLVEVSYLQKGNDSLPVCGRCYYKQPDHFFHDSKYMFQQDTYSQNDQTSDKIQFCQCCRVNIAKCPRRPKSIAYTLILPAHNLKLRRLSSKSSLENIKVQKSRSRKSFKNRENYGKKVDDRKNSLERERRKETESGIAKRKKTSRSNTDVEETNSKKDETEYTLMEYLKQNRPEFILSAEHRRQMLLNSRILRERERDTLKLNFLMNNPRQSKNGNYKLFTEKEMRDINKKNYQKLPEVQGRLINQRESQLRLADRLISRRLAKKVQKSVLKGKGSFPIDRPLTN